jgi:hypothetical protein
MTYHAAWLARILETHPDVVHVDGATETLIKRDELLVLDTHADEVHDKARRWVDSREDSAAPGVTRLRLVAGTDAADLTHTLRGGAKAHRRWSVTPNHVLSGAPGYIGGPKGRPAPIPPLTAPHADVDGSRPVTVGILDTGVDPHPWFEDKTWYQECTDDQHEALNPELDLESESGHGTFIAGLIMQEAPNAFLRFERVLSPAGVTDEVELINGLDRIEKQVRIKGDYLDILNLSLGCYTFDDRPSPVLNDAITRLGRRTLIVAAAGNFGDTVPTWPAAFRRVVSVGSLTSDLRPSTFSSRGWWVDCSTVGEGILSTYVEGAQSPAFTDDPETFGPNAFARWSGTSFAAPQVTGAIARIAQTQGISARQAYIALLATGRPLPDFGQTFSILPGV